MNTLSSLITYDKEFSASCELLLAQRKNPSPKPIVINGLSDGAAAAYVAESVKLARAVSCAPPLILCGSDAARDKLVSRLLTFGVKAAAYKSRDLVFHNISASHDAERERISVLSELVFGGCDCVVSTPSAAAAYTLPRELLLTLGTEMKQGDLLDPGELELRLSSLGFAKVELVEAAGQYARRGGIVDYYMSADSRPVRIEFFGDEIDRIAVFDVISQRTVANLDSARLTAAQEVMLSPDAREQVLREVKRLYEACREENSKSALAREIAVLEAGGVPESRDKYFSLIYGRCESLLSYITEAGEPLIYLLGSAECESELKGALAALDGRVQALADHGLVDKSYAKYSASREEYASMLASSAICHINTFSGASGSTEALAGLFGFRCRRCVGYGRNASMFLEDMKAFSASAYKVVIICENSAGVKSVCDTLAENGYVASAVGEDFDFSSMQDGQIAVTVGECEGFDLIMARAALISMAEDEGRRVMANRRRQRILKKAGGAERIMSYADLSVGDYVVHASYGIGMFEGIESVRVDGALRDYITIRYAGTDKLFVPCDRLENIGKYIGDKASDGSVKLSKMGGADWSRTKARAKSSAKDIAKKLIELYAARQRSEGFAFASDSELEEEFAQSFPFEETDSQARAIAEIKGDMMRAVPMNRLLCGDVGFGKTEVALRAAFKAVMSGKQVAMLVPTTILALQHYETALARFRSYPVTVEMLSRFKTPREQKRILERTEKGAVDILIGTHKLLSKQLRFRDLGLLIVDEEQRFGVAQKEKLKQLCVNVDTLMLSATPIPRTLNMAMSGIADMSVLDEAPGERRPVQTYVLEHDDAVIADAMSRELLRGGQVLYLHNDIDTISFTADKIMRALPSARVAVAHGRMEKDDLEDIWGALVSQEIDILVCTTIIETGVDLPNANTLIIENADKMGLSQLHQIRGRVGRSTRQAYAYFTYRPGKALSEIATKRLLAIREYAEFGAGFKVALRDLEIRGAGNLLGAEQHGYIDSVGYDLYVKLLSEAVAEERGEALPKRFESRINVKADAHIPEYYIASSSARMEIYKKISLIETPSDADDIYDEISDRFGEIPRTVERLIAVALCRAVAERAEISAIEQKDGKLLFYMERCNLAVWSEVLQKHHGRLIGGTGAAPISYKLRADEDAALACRKVMTDYFLAAES